MLRRTAGPEDPTDGELLRRFTERRDQDAFARLIGRHGPLVLGVCRRIVGDHHHAEDAFQACFLVLADRAPRLGGSACLAGFLHEVAVRVGHKQRVRLARAARRDREAGLHRWEAAVAAQQQEHGHLDEELRRLPAAYRDALTLCYLQGLSIDETAAALGITPDGLRGRLHRGKQLLRKRLRHEPLAVAPVALPAGLCEATLAALSAPGPAAVHLAKGVIWSMFMTRLIWPLTAVALLVVAVPMALLAGDLLSPPREAAQTVVPVPEPAPPEGPKGDKEAKAVDPEPAPPVTVRAVKLETMPFALGAWSDAKVLATAEAVEKEAKLAGKREVTAALDEASKQVRFGKESLVVVGFLTGGPPYGKMKYGIDQKKREVEFYCEEPRVTRRGVVMGYGVGFFVVPAGTKVKWGGLK
jgi:RNA polymerase sigma factor (sigma-70 family)